MSVSLSWFGTTSGEGEEYLLSGVSGGVSPLSGPVLIDGDGDVRVNGGWLGSRTETPVREQYSGVSKTKPQPHSYVIL
jgi:hypothetical protein